MERIGGFFGVGDQLNAYYLATGNPDYFHEDLSRYRALAAADVHAAAAHWLPLDRRVELVVEPATGKDGKAEGRKDGGAESRNDGSAEGRKDGRPAGRNGGMAEGRNDKEAQR